ncbi:hypothetical protein BLY21_002843 [Escherichia coli]|nr:hypothetical protein [Escherichia coli]
MRIGVFQRYQMKCKSVSKKSPRYMEQRNLPDVVSLYAVMQEQFGLGVDDAKHGFTVDELALVMAAFDTHPEAGK